MWLGKSGDLELSMLAEATPRHLEQRCLHLSSARFVLHSTQIAHAVMLYDQGRHESKNSGGVSVAHRAFNQVIRM
jgi:hypothetical protein